MKENRKITVIRVLICFLLVTTFTAFTVALHNRTIIKADNVFDHAVDWEPLQLKDLKNNTYYRITLIEAQKINFENINSYWWKNTIYKPNGVSVEPSNDKGWDYYLEAGTYYIRPDRDCEGSWYRISEPTDKTDLTNDANLIGTPFEGYTLWAPMTTLSSDTCSGDTLKIILNERSHIEFRCDDGSWGNWGDDVYDSYCRKLKDTSIGYFEDEWEAGTYFIKLWEGWKNIYYVLSAPEKATNITISSSNISLSVGEATKLTYEIAPANCTDTVTWKSTDTNIATIKNDGTITAVSAGTCIVQVTTGSGKAALCKVTVKKNSSKNSNIVSKKKTNITIKKGNKIINSVVIKKGKSVTLKVKASSKGKLSLGKLTKKQKKIAYVTLKRGKIKIKGKKKGRISLKIKSAKTSKDKKATKTIKIFIK